MYTSTIEEFKTKLQSMNEMELYLEFSNILGDIEILDFQKKTKKEMGDKESIEIENELSQAYTRANTLIPILRKYGVTTIHNIDTIDTTRLHPFSEKLKWWLSYWKKWETNMEPKTLYEIQSGFIGKEELKKHWPTGNWRDSFYENKSN